LVYTVRRRWLMRELVMVLDAADAPLTPVSHGAHVAPARLEAA